MTPGNADLVRSLYGFNWVSVREREQGLAAAAEVMAPDVEARISPEIGDRVLHGLEGFALFVQGLEEDFSEFRYEAEELSEAAPDQVVVTGQIHVRGRMSKMPLTAPFWHLWSFREGKTVRIEAHLAPGHALSPAEPA
jgi:hypothetical protein